MKVGNISSVEKEAYSRLFNIDIFFQENAWMNRAVMGRWVEQTWKPFVAATDELASGNYRCLEF